MFCFFSLSQNSRPNKLLSLTHWNSVACDFCSVSQPFEMYLYFTLYNQNLCTIQRLTPSVQMRSEWNVNCFFFIVSVRLNQYFIILTLFFQFERFYWNSRFKNIISTRSNHKPNSEWWAPVSKLNEEQTHVNSLDLSHFKWTKQQQ